MNRLLTELNFQSRSISGSHCEIALLLHGHQEGSLAPSTSICSIRSISIFGCLFSDLPLDVH